MAITRYTQGPVTVTLDDGATLPAKILGRDPRTDIAVLSIDRTDLHPARRSNELPAQGDMVFAFGSPFEFRFSMSSGIVSGIGRSAGLAEVIKYGPIADMAFLAWIEAHIDGLMAHDPQALAHSVKRSCEIKAWVVSQDERESGLRAILNFGHTFGHAIEAGLGFGVWLHGEAVGCGMVMAAHLSQRLGLVDEAFVKRLTHLIGRAGLPVVGPSLGAEAYLHHMRVDKKAQAGDIRFVLIDGPGKAVVRGAPDALVAEVIEACCRPA